MKLGESVKESRGWPKDDTLKQAIENSHLKAELRK